MIFTHIFTRFAAAVLLCSFTTSACMSTRQSQMGIGLGIAGVGLGTGLAYANASSKNPETAVVVFGGLMSLVGYVAALTGAGSLGPNRRLDELEVMNGTSFTRARALPPARRSLSPATPASAGDSSQLPAAWSGFMTASHTAQNEFLLQRRAIQVVGEDPFILVPAGEACPDGHAQFRRILSSLAEGRLTVCRLLEDTPG